MPPKGKYVVVEHKVKAIGGVTKFWPPSPKFGPKWPIEIQKSEILKIRAPCALDIQGMK